MDLGGELGIGEGESQIGLGNPPPPHTEQPRMAANEAACSSSTLMGMKALLVKLIPSPVAATKSSRTIVTP
jgi:hypothetical protein